MDIVHMTPPGFTELFQKHRNIFIVEFDQGLSSVKTEAKKNVWSQPQIVIQVKAPNPEAFAEELRKKGASFFNLVRQTEYARLEKAYKSAPATVSENKIRKKFNIDLDIPLGFNVVLDEPDFLWMKRDAGKYDQGIFIYRRPYLSMNQLNYENIILLRDTLTRQYVPGPLEGSSHMSVELLFPPVSKDVNIKGNFAVEMRGEWKVEGDMMGGPFVNYTVIDTVRNQMICMDGYVYNPGGDKRDALIHVEGIFHTLRFVP
jgi:hypothetical protein